MIKNNIKQEIIPVAFLTIVVCASVILLSLTNDITSENIEKAKNEAVKSMLNEQFPSMDDYSYYEKSDTYTVFSNDKIVGYAFMANANGYGGSIEILVALENTLLTEDDIVIHGISVISHSETPGLGERIVETVFSSQFNGITTDEVALKDNGGKIDAISGATISSSAVVEAVYKNALEKAKEIRENKDLNFDEGS